MSPHTEKREAQWTETLWAKACLFVLRLVALGAAFLLGASGLVSPLSIELAREGSSQVPSLFGLYDFRDPLTWYFNWMAVLSFSGALGLILFAAFYRRFLWVRLLAAASLFPTSLLAIFASAALIRLAHRDNLTSDPLAYFLFVLAALVASLLFLVIPLVVPLILLALPKRIYIRLVGLRRTRLEKITPNT